MHVAAVIGGIVGGGVAGWFAGIALCPDRGDIGIGTIPWALGGCVLGMVVGGVGAWAVT